MRLSFTAMAIATAVISLSALLALTMLAVALAGAAWVLALALFNTSVQLSTPRWVVGRALSFYQMCTFGGMALGSWLWGTLTETHSIQEALQLAAASTLVGVIVGFRWAVPARMERDLEPLDRWQEPPVGLDILPRSGPVSVAVEYLIDEAEAKGGARGKRARAARDWVMDIDPEGDLDQIREGIIRRIVALK